MKFVRPTLQKLAAPAIVFYTLPALMALLVAGTLAQGSMGIYDVQRLYFSSFILWAGPIPLPGGATLLSLLALNLTVKFIAFSEWNWRKAGIILAHLGALTLLVGGLLTALTAREGYMAIAEGEVSPFVYDYHARTLSVFKGDQGIAALPFDSLRPGMEIKGLPFTLTPLDVCLNCDIQKRADVTQPFLKGEPRDFAANMALTPKPPEMENEVNLSGLTFAIDGATENENGSYIAFEGMPRPIEIGDYKIILGKTQRTLPFALELKDFRKADHPGTTMAAGFESDIIVKDGPANHPAAISMNKPLRYKGYTFYQSSFDQSNEADISVLSVVENQGRLVPYIGTLLIAAGLILHLAFALRRKMALIVFLCLLAPSAHAQTLPLNDFSTLPIQHEGRIKPLDSFARTMLSRLSGSENNASAWLAQSLFDPASAAETPLFKKPGEKNLISYTALQPFILETAPEVEKLLAEQPATLTQDQQNLLQLHDHFAAYGQILRALTLVLPLSAPPPESLKSLGPKNYELSYLDFSRLREDIDTLVKTTLKRKGENVETYTEEELRTVQLSYALDQIKSGAKPNTIFAVIPSENSVWQTPWESTSSPQSATTLALWQSAALAWQKNDAEGWSAALQSLRAETAARDDVRPAALRAENIYHALAPYTLAIALYALALLLLAIPRLQTFAAPAAALALGLHTTGITLRVFILERPPVGTLYESVLFVGLIAALIGLITTLKTKSRLPLAAGTFAGLALLLIAPLCATDPAALDVLGAVLDTNFWLGTHVLVITSGYGMCILAALLSHLYLWQAREGLFALLYKTSLAALLFTAVGTILGGIWADQSWGRFWGWDPKENGALLIVLWLIWAQHGRLSGHLTPRNFAAALAFLNVIVALAWFGVNLLGVGLHSYGFTTGLAAGLATFCALETALIAALWWKGRS